MQAWSEIELAGEHFCAVDLPSFAGSELERLPYVHRVLLENVLRNAGEDALSAGAAILHWLRSGTSKAEIPFLPGRVLMHDTTCGPALVDIAAMRSSLAEAGGDPQRLSPVLPVDVSTDHSVAVDFFGTRDALGRNMEREFARNAERYRFMKWAANVLPGFQVHPPGTGIMHTLNLERLATVVATIESKGRKWAVPDTLIGTDSHTPMVNGIGVLAWGVGGLEAESVMFGMPLMLRVPDVLGVRLSGRLREGVMATDLALTVTERLRRVDLAGCFVEFFGPGVSGISAGVRAVVANMTPEFGGACGYFAIDHRTLAYLAQTGRSSHQIQLVADYAKRQGLWFDPQTAARYTEVIDLDLGTVEVSLAGPRRPQDRIAVSETAAALGLQRGRSDDARVAPDRPPDGAVAIAAITSCTNTSDPRLLVAAGLLARNARCLGLRPPNWVKTSLAPGSPAAERHLTRAGLMEDLQSLGFGIVGYGCTTCIGNSGPLTERMMAAIATDAIRPVAVLSGNRNFPGRVHPAIEDAFLASPPLVVAFALAGDANRNITTDPIGHAAGGKEVHLSDLWPSEAEIDEALERIDTADHTTAPGLTDANETWRALDAPFTALFPWSEDSTYIRRPPFAKFGSGSRLGTYAAHPLIVLGDDITTDHISPAGQIPPHNEAALHLIRNGADPHDLNVFSSRRGNWEVMLRGLFTNSNVVNLLGTDLRPGFTIHPDSNEPLPLWRAAARYEREGVPVVVVAGERYGMGSSRDWAAKGLALLGVRAVLASGFERIHRSNLIGMGILPLLLPPCCHPEKLCLRPGDLIEIDAPTDRLEARGSIPVTFRRVSGAVSTIHATAMIDTRVEIDLLQCGGVIPSILRRALDVTAAHGGHDRS